MDPSGVDGEGAPACARARRLAPAAIAGSLPRPDRRWLWSHLAACDPCRQHTRGGAEVAAAIGRTMRAARQASERRGRRRLHRALALGAIRDPRRGRMAHLRLLLLPAAAIVLMTRLAPLPDPAAQGVVLAGGATIAGRELGPSSPPADLWRGERCSTQDASRARIEAGTCRAEVGPSSRVLLEDPTGRLRLEWGELALEGRCLVTTALGVVEVRGSGWLALDPGGLAVEARSGELSVSDSRGERRLMAGEGIRLAGPGP